MAGRYGAMRERLVILDGTPAAIAVSSVTRSATTATVTTAAPHGYTTGDYVTIAGATPAGYNGKVRITVTGPTTFTYTVSGAPATPATGTITGTYVSDAQGGRNVTWRTLETIAAELLPQRAGEQLQAEAITAQIDYRFRTHARPDLRETMRALWTPSWPPAAPQQTLEIHGVLPIDHGRDFLLLECGRAA